MPKNVVIVDRQDLEAVTVPANTVSHKFVIDTLTAELASAGLNVKQTIYHMTPSGQAAAGICHIESADPDMDPIIMWANTYDKTMRFKCSAGGHLKVTNAYMIGEDLSGYKIDHTLTSEGKVVACVKAQVANIHSHVARLNAHMKLMNNIQLTNEDVAHMMGVLYFQKDAITSSQLIKVKNACKKDVSNLWTIYRHIAIALKSSHPKTWIDQQMDVHAYVKNNFLLNIVPTVDPNQTTLPIDEVESTEQVSVQDSAQDDVQVEVISEKTENLTLEDYAVKVQVKEEHADQLTIDNNTVHLNPQPVSEQAEEPEVDNSELLSSDTEDGDFDNKKEFPEPPVDLPVSGGEQVKPLEEQVAGEYVAPISEAEKAASAAPVVDEPKEEVKEEEDLSFLEEGPLDDPNFTPEDSKKNTPLEAPNFEF